MRFEWVLMDIPQCQEIIPVSNWLALESLLKEMSYSSILVINLLFVYPSQYNVIDSAI